MHTEVPSISSLLPNTHCACLSAGLQRNDPQPVVWGYSPSVLWAPVWSLTTALLGNCSISYWQVRYFIIFFFKLSPKICCKHECPDSKGTCALSETQGISALSPSDLSCVSNSLWEKFYVYKEIRPKGKCHLYYEYRSQLLEEGTCDIFPTVTVDGSFQVPLLMQEPWMKCLLWHEFFPGSSLKRSLLCNIACSTGYRKDFSSVILAERRSWCLLSAWTGRAGGLRHTIDMMQGGGWGKPSWWWL